MAGARTFLAWQCRVRQSLAREAGGRPDAGVAPAIYPVESAASVDSWGQIITVLIKRNDHSTTPEFQHMARSTADPAIRLEKILKFLSAGYYQDASSFENCLYSTFAAGSKLAKDLCRTGKTRLVFDAYGHHFDLPCDVHWRSSDDPGYQAVWWHNYLFNPALPADCQVLSFRPEWVPEQEGIKT